MTDRPQVSMYIHTYIYVRVIPITYSCRSVPGSTHSCPRSVPGYSLLPSACPWVLTPALGLSLGTHSCPRSVPGYSLLPSVCPWVLTPALGLSLGTHSCPRSVPGYSLLPSVCPWVLTPALGLSLGTHSCPRSVPGYPLLPSACPWVLTPALGLHTVGLAVVLRVEAVDVAVTAAVPEPGAAAVLHVEEPAHREVTARTALLRQAAQLCGCSVGGCDSAGMDGQGAVIALG